MGAGVLTPPSRLDLPDAACPFRGLVPFSERDAEYFFGRTAEREIIAANLIASPLTLLYSASGVGKSSVLRAGVLHDLIDSAHDSIGAGYGPEYIPVLVRDWRLDPIGALRRGLADGVRAVLGPVDPVEAGSVAAEVTAWSERTGATMLVILDQFEEFLLYHGDGWGPGDPAAELAAALCNVDRSASFLLALREDAIAGLDRFKGRVPRLFDNYLRLRQLAAKEAVTAIEGPVGRWNERHPDDRMGVEPELVREVLTQVGDGRLALAGAGQGRPAGTADDGIEAPFLQLVMTRVWEAERDAGSACLRRETLVELGGSRRIVASYLDEQMGRLTRAERDVASDVFHQLVTPSGAKVARSAGDLSAYTGAPAEALADVLGKLSQGEEWRILRPESDPRGGPVSYEIFHDVLADPVLDWRARHEAVRAGDRAVAAARRRTRRRILWGLLAGVILAVLVALTILYAIGARHQKQVAERARIEADAGAAAASARIALASDPELSALLAQEALKLKPDSAAGNSVLRAALGEDRSLGRLGSMGSGYGYVQLSPDAKLAIAGSEDGTMRAWRVADHKLLYSLVASHGDAVLDPKGTRIVVPEENTATVRDASTSRALATLRGTGLMDWASFEWSPDARRLLGSCGADACVWSAETGRVLHRFRFVPQGGSFTTWAGSHRIAIVARPFVAVLNARGGTLLRLRRVSDLRAFGISKDGHTAVVGDRGAVLSAWNLATGATTRLRTDAASSVVGLDAHGAHVLVSDFSGRARVLDTRTGEPTAFLNGHSAEVTGGWISDGGHIGVTASRDGTARAWDLRLGTQLAAFGGGAAPLAGVAVSKSGIALTIDATGAVRLWRLWPSWDATLREARTRMRSAEVSRDGRTVVVASDRGVRVWERSRGALAGPRHLGGKSRVKRVALSPDGRSVLVAGPRRATVLSLADGRPIGSSMGVDIRGDHVNRAAFSPDGRLIVTAQRDGSAVLWSTDGHRRLRQLGLAGAPTHHNELNDVAFSADSRLLVVGGGDRLVRVFDTRTGKPVNTFPLPKAPADDSFSTTGVDHAIRAVALQPNGTRVAAGDADGFVHLWDRKDRAVHRVIPVGGKVTALAFSPDGALLATAAGGDAKLWDVSTGQPVSTLTYGMTSVTGIGFSRDGRMVLGADGVIRMFGCDLCGSNTDLQKLAKRLVKRKLTREERATNLPKDLR